MPTRARSPTCASAAPRRRYEKEYLRPDGSRVPVLVSGVRVSRRAVAVLATVYDLTERKAVEREVRQPARPRARRALRRRARAARASAACRRSPPGCRHRSRPTRSRASSSTTRSRTCRRRPGSCCARRRRRDLARPRDRLPARRASSSGAGSRSSCRRAGDRRRVAHCTTMDLAARVGADAGARLSSPCPLLAGTRLLGALAHRLPRAAHADRRGPRVPARRSGARPRRRSSAPQLFENRAYVARKLQEGLLPEPARRGARARVRGALHVDQRRRRGRRRLLRRLRRGRRRAGCWRSATSAARAPRRR